MEIPDNRINKLRDWQQAGTRSRCVADLLATIRSGLSDSGPEVIMPALIAFIDDERERDPARRTLTPERAEKVGTLIVRYHNWFEAYWRELVTIGLVDSAAALMDEDPNRDELLRGLGAFVLKRASSAAQSIPDPHDDADKPHLELVSEGPEQLAAKPQASDSRHDTYGADRPLEPDEQTFPSSNRQTSQNEIRGRGKRKHLTVSRRASTLIAIVAAVLVVAWILTHLTRKEVEEKAPDPEPSLLQLQDTGRPLQERNGTLSGFDGVEEEWQEVGQKAWDKGETELPMDLLQELRSKSDVFMGKPEDGASFRLVKPVGQFVLSDLPSFEWTRSLRAISYVVLITDLADPFSPILSGELTETKWTLDSSVGRLRRGHRYSWKVEARRENNIKELSPKTPGHGPVFEVLSQSQFQRIEQLRQQSQSSYLLGVSYARFGILDDAEFELNRFHELNKESPLATRIQTMLEHVQRTRRALQTPESSQSK
jgi:hypothetical protein